MKNKVSVIIPIYNAEKYLYGTLRCLLYQDYPEYEIIAVNDCSCDGSVDIINEFESRFRDRNIDLILVDREINGGLCAAINSGIEAASGNYFCFPDADDEIAPDYLSSMMNVLESNPDKKWVRCNYTIVLEEENREYDVLLPEKSFYSNDFYDFISKFIPHNAWNMIVSRNYFEYCIGKHIYDSRLTQEWSLLLPLSYHSDYARCDKVLYRYHIRKNAMSSWQNKDIASVITHIDELEQLNLTMIGMLKTEDSDLIRRSRQALDIYYHLMRYKKYIQNSYDEMAQSELDKLYASVGMILSHGTAKIIDDPDIYVRLSFDRLLGADTFKSQKQFENYKKMFKNGYIALNDKAGAKMLSVVTAAYGTPVKVIDYSQFEPSEWKSYPKACLIENSQKFKELVNSDADNRDQYIDYRDIRDSVRGWAAKEVIS